MRDVSDEFRPNANCVFDFNSIGHFVGLRTHLSSATIEREGCGAIVLNFRQANRCPFRCEFARDDDGGGVGARRARAHAHSHTLTHTLTYTQPSDRLFLRELACALQERRDSS